MLPCPLFEFKEEESEALKSVNSRRPCCGNCQAWDWLLEVCAIVENEGTSYRQEVGR